MIYTGRRVVRGHPEGQETVIQHKDQVINCTVSGYSYSRTASCFKWALASPAPCKSWNLQSVLQHRNKPEQTKQFWVYKTPQEFQTPKFLCNNMTWNTQIQCTRGYLLLQRVAGAQRLASSCCCPSIPSCPLAQFDRQNWFCLFSGLCCQGPRNISFIGLLYNNGISSLISVRRRTFVAHNLPSSF